MALVPKTFKQLITFTRGSGATRINVAGAIVGVDFSTTSNTITTGSKTFTLTATAGVNRDWVVGGNVTVVAQAGATGSMTGTVTSYSAATQALVINVVSITGSGTSTNWRIGDLDPRLDYNPITLAARGLLVEVTSTNILLATDALATQTRSITTNAAYTLSFYGTGSITLSGGATGTFTGNGAFPSAITQTTFTPAANSLTLTVTGSVTFAQLELGTVATSYIPTTTVAASRSADIPVVSGTAFTLSANAEGGAFVANFEPKSAATGAMVLSVNDGTTMNTVRAQQKQSGTISNFRAVVTDGVTDIWGLTNSVTPSVRSNGVDLIQTADASGASGVVVAYNGTNEFMLGGSGETFRSSTDNGVTYVQKNVGGTLNNGIFAAGRYVIASTAGFRVSTDSIAWRRVNVTGQVQSQNEIAHNGTNLFVSVGNAGTAYTSPDAETWALQNTGRTGNTLAITFGLSLFVAAVQGTTTQSVITSPDGVTWTSRTTPAITAIDVAYNGTNLFVLVGNVGAVQTSPDAVTWTTRTSGTTNTLRGVFFAAGQWIACGDAGTIITSPDGTTWTTQTSGTTQALNEVIYVPFPTGALWVAVGAAGTIITSPTGVTWTTRVSNTTSVFNGLLTNGSTLVASGATGVLMSTTDGITYASRNGNNATLTGVAYGNNTYVLSGGAINGSGLLATVDQNGVYVRRVSNSTAGISNVRFLQNKFYACMASVVGVPSLQTSVDGVTWVSAGGPVGSGTVDVAYGNGVYIAFRLTSFRVLTSTDGITFGATELTLTNTLISQSPRGVAFSDGTWVAVGNNGTIVTTSGDPLVGTNWVQRTSGTTTALYAVMYSARDGLWYVAGDNGLMLSSPDTITWTSVANRAIGAAFVGGALVANPILPALIPNAPNKIGISYGSTGLIVSVNGSVPVTTPITVPLVDRLSIGVNAINEIQLNGWMRTANYYAGIKTTAQLQALTI